MRKRPTDVRTMMASLATRMAGPAPAVKPNRAKRRAAPKPPGKAVALVVDNTPKPKVKIEPGVLSGARARSIRRAAADRQERPNPFRLPDFPPQAIPSNSADRMAADEMPGLAWASGAYPSNVFWEGQAFLGYQYLAELSQRPEYRRISERIATEATRKWIKLQITGDEDDEEGDPEAESTGAPEPGGRGLQAKKLKIIEDELTRLKVKDAFRKISEQDGFFGRAHLYLDTGDGENPDELKTPLGDGRGAISRTKVTPEKPLQRIKPIEAMWCYPLQYNTNQPLEPAWYRPQSWIVLGKQVHVSRIIPFVAREVPDLIKPAYAFGGLALSQMAKPYVDNFLRTRQSVSDLISSFSTMVLHTDLQTTVQAGGDQLFARMDLFNLLRDNRGLMAVNKESEDLTNVTTPLGTLDALQAQSQEQMASVCGIPIVILLGIQPMGLNASSEGEIRVFYDMIAAYQESFFRDALTKVINFIQLSKFGEIDPDITFRFEPLWSLDEKAKADVKKIEAETDKVLIEAGVLHPEESRERIASDPESPYTSINVEDVPEAPVEVGGFGLPGRSGGSGGAEVDGPGKPQSDFGGAQDSAYRTEPAALDAEPSGHAAGILFVAKSGDVLLLRRSSAEANFAGHWALPGGGVDDGETPEEGAMREAAEEMGVRPSSLGKLLDRRMTPTRKAFHTFAFPVKEQFVPKLNDEHSGYAWAPFHQLPQPLHPAVERTLKERIGVADDMTPDDAAKCAYDFIQWATAGD